ncbi:unnamed protein product [Sphagnum jensenii]|uniref:Uncharacterized protein n=1 Tax=Sphagnum jensenii TaxID=128206 RepID=A0ABP1BB02_9BRYO
MSDTGAYLAPEGHIVYCIEQSSSFECGGRYCVVQRQLTVDVLKNTKAGSCVDVQLRFVAIEGDGVGPATVMMGAYLDPYWL